MGSFRDLPFPRTVMLTLLLVLTACGGSDSAAPGPTPPPTVPPPPPTVPDPPAPSPSPSGLDARPANASCRAGDGATATGLAIERVFPSLTFTAPVLMLQEPLNGARWYVVEKAGAVRVFDNQANVTASRMFIDLTSVVVSNPADERGLLGMAFHPDYPANPRVYLSYTANAGSQLVSRIVEYRTVDGGQTLDPGSATTILQVNQPETNHNGGNIAFGPDRMLYIGFGDGGGGGDGHGAIGNGQRLSTLLGKMLRIDVNSTSVGALYGIPSGASGNPYAGGAVCNNDTGAFTQNCPEIYAYGFRNPWRWSFDRVTGDLWVADVGQSRLEEVNRVVRGGNYGWRCFEGASSFNSTCGANAASSLPPVAEYGRALGTSITGGFVYRGTAMPGLSGRYFFGDYASGFIWNIATDTPPTLTVTGGMDSGLNISSFGEGADGEIHVVNISAGTLHRLRAATVSGSVPTQLSATGCLNAPGLIPYAPNAPFWSDNASKTRSLALPDGQQITINATGDFEFPNGSVLVKNFLLGTRLVETRLFMRHNNGAWAGYTYEWDAQGTDATRVVGGKSVQVAGQTWNFPSEAQCMLCHTAAAGHTLGLEVPQLNGNFGYAQTGRTANQLTTLNSISLFTSPLTTPVAQLPAMPDPLGTASTLGERARAYLHTNCANCHRPGGGTNVSMDLRYTTALASTNACEVTPVNSLGVANARLIAVGGTAPAARSMVTVRAGLADANSMPPIQPRIVDAAGVALLSEWINSLGSCN